MAKKNKPYLDNEGRALPYPFLINFILWLVGGSQTVRLKFWSRKPRHIAEKTLRDILTISRDTVYGKEHHFERILSATTAEDFFRLYRLIIILAVCDKEKNKENNPHGRRR